MCSLGEESVREIIESSSLPIVFRGFINNWPLCQWSAEKWCSAFGDRELPFRTMSKSCSSNEPCWERRCNMKKMNFKNFLETLDSNPDWLYYDYKYMQDWFRKDDEIYKEVFWKQFGYADKTAADSTLWVGSEGAHTPAHQDAYGVNIVAQLHGKKRWLLFPPETGGLKATRVPYEESSIYSDLNFYCPSNLHPFLGLSGGRVVELSAGDALLVPRGWWHYVQNVAPLSIAVNTWLPHEQDASTQVSEALIRIFVAQICKDLPEETTKLILNPNEDDISDTPLAVLFLQLETVAKSYFDKQRKARRAKRQKTREDDPIIRSHEGVNIKTLLDNPANHLEVPQAISGNGIVELLKCNIKKYVTDSGVEEVGDGDIAGSLCLTKAVIDAFSEKNAIEQVKQKLFARLS